MANPITSLLLITSYLIIATQATNYSCPQNTDRRPGPAERVAKLHFYVQEIVGGECPTVYEVARAPITSISPTNFGRVVVEDSPMTAEPDKDSKRLGRLQSIVAFSDFETPALVRNYAFYFTSWPYNGSTIGGSDRIETGFDTESEVPVNGGTGVFRSAKGYGYRSVYSVNGVTGDRVVRYTFYVTIYA